MTKCRRLLILALALPTLTTVAQGQTAFPERDGIVANGSSYALSSARINREFDERIGQPYGLEGLVLVVRSCRPDPEVYLDSALPYYGLASGAGQLRDRAVVLLVCEEPRFVGMFYGANNPYAGRLDQERTTAAMVDHLAAGDFTGAVTAGIDRMARDLAADGGAAPADGARAGLSPSRTGGPVAPPGGGASSAAPTVEPAAPGRDATGSQLPADGRRGNLPKWVWPVVLGVAGLATWRLWRRQNPSRSSAARPQPGPEAALRAKMAELERDLRADSAAFSHLVLAYAELGDEAVVELNRRHVSMLERLAELQRQTEALTSGVVAVAMAEDKEEWSARVGRLLAEADALLEYVHGVAAEAERVAAWLERAPVLLVAARQAITAGRQAYEEQAAGLGLTNGASLFRWVEQIANQAEAALTAGNRISAGRLAEAASSLSDRLVQIAEDLRTVQLAVDAAAARFAAADQYAVASWADVRGNGSEAEESLATAKDQLERIGAAEAAAFGKDLASGLLASLDRVDAEIARARELTSAIVQRFEALEKAKADATVTLADVRAEIAAARGWLAQPAVDADVDTRPTESLDQAAAWVEAAAGAMMGEAPDWPAIVRQLQEARRAVDAALAHGRQQQERMAALQRELATAVTEAEAALSRAERFLAAHAADISAESRAKLEQAQNARRLGRDQERLAMASEDQERAAALRRAIDGLAQATDLATEAYGLMARDFEAEEERRQPHLPRRQWVGPTVPVPMDLPSWGNLLPRGLPGPAMPPRSPGRWGGRPARPPGLPGESSRRGGGRGW